MPKYPVLEPLDHDQKAYGEGDTVELTEKQAAALLAVAVIGDAGGEPAIPQAARAIIAQVKTIQDVAELDQLADGETRATVLAAIEARRKELEA